MCGSSFANLDLTDLTTAVHSASSYTSDPYWESVIHACTTTKTRALVAKYYGKQFDFAITDLTGANGEGPTAKYTVALINTSTKVTFTLTRRTGGSGYVITGIS